MKAVVLALSLLVAAGVPEAGAQPFPSRAIRIIAPIPPGSTIDIIARIMAASLQKSTGQPVVVENRPGASSMIGMTAAARAPADGYTLVVVALGQLVQTPIVLDQKAPFDPVRDFAPVAQLATGPVVMSVHPSVQATSVRALVDLAKARPGQLNFGSNGVGTANHIVAEMLKQLAGIDLLHVAYKGNAEAITGLVGGEVSVVFTGIAPVVGFVRAGKLRLLATTGRQRAPLFPDVPTMAEAGFPEAQTLFWYGMAAPAATPPDVVAYLNQHIVAALAQPEVRDGFVKQGLDPEPTSATEFARIVREEHARWTRVIRAAGIKPE